MKFLKSLPKFAAMLAVALCFTACSEDHVDPITEYVYLENADIDYNASGFWADCNNTSVGAFTVDNVVFSHEAGSTYYPEWDFTLNYWNGFCPSRVVDTADHSDTGFVGLYEWASITGGGVRGTDTPYIVGFWKSDEVDTYSLNIKMADGKPFQPVGVYVTNNTYAYYTMKYGDSFCKKFGEGDWFRLHIKGVANGGFSGEVTVDLANGTDILDTWKRVDLSSLGYVDALVFTLSSSDSNEWGMNTPAYFCLDGFSYVK